MRSLRARLLRRPADPVALARALQAAGAEHVCLLHSGEPATVTARVSYVAAFPDRTTSRLDPFEGDDLHPASGGPLAYAPRWVGVIPYEAMRELERAGLTPPDSRPSPLVTSPEWFRFPAVLRVDHESGEVVVIGADDRAIERLARAAGADVTPAAAASFTARDADAPELHVERVRRAVELILAGDLYQVNVARRLDVELEGDWLEGYRLLASRAPAAFGAALDLGHAKVLSTSPELLLHGPLRFHRDATTDWIFTEPIKGTRPRGSDARSDEARVRELEGDPKERAELAMIVDVERNDLGRVARIGSVRLAQPPRVVTHRTVHHRKALLAAALRPGVSRRELLEAMVPSGSVTGAPKVRAMEVIGALEGHRRGLYTGGFGFAAHDGSLTLAMAIRTAVLAGDGDSMRGEYFTGGGIVADSDPERELAETRWKAAQVTVASRAVNAR